MNEELHVGRLAFPRIMVSAALSDEDGRMLLVRPAFSPCWDLPGGHLGTGETPSQSCQRQLNEQLCIPGRTGALLVADWAPHPAEGDKIHLLFDGGQLGAGDEARLRLDPAVTAEYAFCALDDLDNLLPERLARRALAAVFARDRGRTLYLEHGLLSCTGLPSGDERIPMPPQPGWA